MSTIFWILLGYLIGSVNYGLVIGKVFYHIDIREYGSKNAGGTNAGRVLGQPVGYIVIILDCLKAFFTMAICNIFNAKAVAYAGLACCVGHCFPIFANFKGGKAVASSYGYLLGLSIFVTNNLLTIIIPLTIFLIILFTTKMVSLSSMISLLSASVYLFTKDLYLGVLMAILALFVIYRHKANIQRIINKTESKIKI